MNSGPLSRRKSYLNTSIRPGKGRRSGRRQSIDEEYVVFANVKNAHDILREILVHLIRDEGVTKARKLAYLNALVRYYKELSHNEELGFTDAQLIYCLRSCVLHKHSVIRAATFRCLRYIITTPEKVELFYQYKLDWCIARSLDLHFSHDIERNQAIRLCRHLLELHPLSLQPSIVLPFIAVAGDGASNSERMVLSALEFLCELAYVNASLLSRCGGVQILLQHIIKCHDSPRINEALIQTLFHLLNNPQSRQDSSLANGLDQLLAPFTDTHYRHKNDNTEGSARSEERLLHCHACSQALLSTLHTWPGLVAMCNPLSAGLSSLVNSLPHSSGATQKIVLQLTYNVFLLRLPKWTDNFEEALISCDPSTPDYCWKLKEGFVAAECLAVYKAVCSRPNLIDNHLSLLLSTFITYGILEALCDVVVKSDCMNSVWATILLGELLHMSYLLLPWSDTEHTHYLPTLITASNSLLNTREQRSQAHQAVEYLDRLHTLKKRGRVPSSLHLELLISFIPVTQSAHTKSKPQSSSTPNRVEHYLPQDTEDGLLMMIRDSLVLVETNSLKWRWRLINSILKSKNVLRKVEDFTLNRFLAKLLHFYNPGVDNGFCTIKLSDSKARLYTSTGLLLIERILHLHSEEATRHLKSLLSDISHCLNEIRQESPVQEARLGLNHIFSCCCQNYFLFIGKLSHYIGGLTLLEETDILQQLLDLVTITSHGAYVKLTVSSLDYTKEGMCRMILSKALTATDEHARLYTADFMRALLRLGVPFFSNWCMDLLITQLYDQSRNVSMRSLSVLNEACEDQSNLLSLIATRPSVLHLGEMGALLVTRYLSVQEGFKFLRSASFLDKELDHWHESFNIKYASVVDNLLAESLSSFEKSYDDTVQRRSSALRRPGKSVYVPPHLYGQLIQHSEGAEIVSNLPYLSEYFDTIRYHDIHSDNTDNIPQCKAAIWIAGHIGTSVYGLPLLDKQDVIPSLASIAERSPVLTLRGTAFYALGLIASTQAGVQRLAELGWRSVMNHRSEEWPVLSDQLIYSDPDAVREIRSASQGSSASQNSQKSVSTSDASSRYEDEGARSRASTDEFIDDIRHDINEQHYQENTKDDPFEPAVRNGKAHSTSELVKSALVTGHRRCSSDSVRTIKPELIIQPSLPEDDKLSQTVSIDTVTPIDSKGDTTPDLADTDRPIHKPALRQSSSKTLADPDGPLQSKTRSLSWRSDVVNRNSSEARNAESFSSHVSSVDSAIDTKSISPIDTGMNGSRTMASLVDRNAMSLPRNKKKPSSVKRGKFSSLPSPNHKQHPPKSLYETSKAEFGLSAVRILRRQASASSSNDSSSQHLNTSLQSITPLKHSISTDNIIKPWSNQGDIDALTDVRKLSDIEPPQSLSVRYMGLALPLDVTAIFELNDGLQLPRGSMDSDIPVVTFNYDELIPISQAKEGLELHSLTNCILCVSLSSLHGEQTADKVSPEKSTPQSVSLLRKECIRFITTICSSIGVNAAEEGLLRLREQMPDLFLDLCLYSEVSAILSTYSYHLPARRFIQELFQDIKFDKVFCEAIDLLGIDLNEVCCERHQPPPPIADEEQE